MMMLELQRRKIDDEARKTEQRHLAGIHQLLLRCLEVISFIDILSENNLKQIASRFVLLAPWPIQRLSKSKRSDMLCKRLTSALFCTQNVKDV